MRLASADLVLVVAAGLRRRAVGSGTRPATIPPRPARLSPLPRRRGPRLRSPERAPARFAAAPAAVGCRSRDAGATRTRMPMPSNDADAEAEAAPSLLWPRRRAHLGLGHRLGPAIPAIPPSSSAGRDCVPTSTVCTGGPIDYDVDGDGSNETRFDPRRSAFRCTSWSTSRGPRTTTRERPSTTPLASSSGRARAQPLQADVRPRGPVPRGLSVGQNSPTAATRPAMNMYMTGPGEPHCDALAPLQHHALRLLRDRRRLLATRGRHLQHAELPVTRTIRAGAQGQSRAEPQRTQRGGSARASESRGSRFAAHHPSPYERFPSDGSDRWQRSAPRIERQERATVGHVDGSTQAGAGGNPMRGRNHRLLRRVGVERSGPERPAMGFAARRAPNHTGKLWHPDCFADDGVGSSCEGGRWGRRLDGGPGARLRCCESSARRGRSRRVQYGTESDACFSGRWPRTHCGSSWRSRCARTRWLRPSGSQRSPTARPPPVPAGGELRRDGPRLRNDAVFGEDLSASVQGEPLDVSLRGERLGAGDPVPHPAAGPVRCTPATSTGLPADKVFARDLLPSPYYLSRRKNTRSWVWTTCPARVVSAAR